MINIYDIEKVSEHVQRRAALMWLQQISNKHGVLIYRVCPHGSEFEHKSKSKRIVKVDLFKGTAECVERFTGEPCQANAEFVLETGQEKTPRLCSHVYAVLTQIAENQRRKRAA